MNYQEMMDRDYPTIKPICHSGVGRGWLPLIRPILDRIMALAGTENPPVVSQIKEKFGGLRFYLDNGTEELFTMVREAEARSYTTCEWCGEPATTHTNRYHRTLCEPCNAKWLDGHRE